MGLISLTFCLIRLRACFFYQTPSNALSLCKSESGSQSCLHLNPAVHLVSLHLSLLRSCWRSSFAPCITCCVMRPFHPFSYCHWLCVVCWAFLVFRDWFFAMSCYCLRPYARHFFPVRTVVCDLTHVLEPGCHKSEARASRSAWQCLDIWNALFIRFIMVYSLAFVCLILDSLL